MLTFPKHPIEAAEGLQKDFKVLAPRSDYFKVPVSPLHSPDKIRALNKRALERRRRINSLQDIKNVLFPSEL